MATFYCMYINEDVGSNDDGGTGTESAPYQSLLRAMIRRDPKASPNYLTWNPKLAHW